MKNFIKNFGIIIFTVIIGLFIAACDGESGGGVKSLDGSWHIGDPWYESFNFNVAELTFSKMSDQGWGERGTFVFTASTFTTTITEITDDGSNWTPFNDPVKNQTEQRTYSFSGNKLLINDEWIYDKVN